jgi:hypothetical protein
MTVATYVSFFFLVDVAAGFFAVVFLAVVFAVVGFLLAVVFLAVVFAVVFAAVGFFVPVVFRAVVDFAAVVFGADVVSCASLFVGAFFPFARVVTGVGRPSQTGRIPIVQSTGFCA